jgi:hypothetical protein
MLRGRRDCPESTRFCDVVAWVIWSVALLALVRGRVDRVRCRSGRKLFVYG